MTRTFLAAFALVLCLAAVPAHAQLDSREAIQLQNQIAELRRDVAGLRDQISRGGSSTLGSNRTAPAPVVSSGSGDLSAGLLDRIGQLEDQVRRLQGRVDEVDNARQRQGDDLKKDLDDLNFKLGSAPAAAAPTVAPPATSSPAAKPLNAPAATAPATTTPAAVRRTPELAMQEGNAALARRDYSAAEAAAKEVLSFPKSPRAYDGQFLLAQAQAGKKDFQGAAVAYDDTYSKSRTGAHAQDALVGLANALTALNEKRAACATLDKLRAEFPTPRADLKESIAGARSKAACR